MAGKGTPAVAVLTEAGVAFHLHEYEHDRDASSYGLEAADKLGVDRDRVFKTLVASVDGALTIAVVPVEGRLDVRALGKRAELAEKADAERATGYVVGGISPLGHRRRLPLLLDESALEHGTILVSGGRRGLEIELDPRDLLDVSGGRAARLASDS